jgi:hypothetical protein
MQRKNDNTKLLDTTRKIRRWMEYIQELFFRIYQDQLVFISMDKRFDIMKKEVSSISKNAKPRKAAGPEEISSELLQLFDDDMLYVL